MTEAGNSTYNHETDNIRATNASSGRSKILTTQFSIAQTQDYFTVNTTPTFYLADTAWSVFSTTTLEEWQEYLDYRRLQGFNVLQIAALPILHDGSNTGLGMLPFQLDQDGHWDFFQVNPEYFVRAAHMVEMATTRGFTCALVPLWCNYAPDTWISQQSSEYVMPREALKPYLEYFVSTFQRFHPIYLAGGDTDFRTERTIDFYLEELETLKRLAPQALVAFHISPYTDLPEQIVASPALDFYTYQSGHKLHEQDFPYTLAEKFYQLSPRRPILNSEPCYEGHGHGGEYGRFSAFSVRKAFWQSVLSGAKAGFTYGAHGVWSWHKRGAAFTSEAWSKTPFDWRAALQLPGAWDVSFAKWVFEQYKLFDLEPGNQLLKTSYTEVRLATSPSHNTIALYLPYNVSVEIEIDLAAYQFSAIDLVTRNILQPEVEITSSGTSIISMHNFNVDTLILGVRHQLLVE